MRPFVSTILFLKNKKISKVITPKIKNMFPIPKSSIIYSVPRAISKAHAFSVMITHVMSSNISVQYTIQIGPKVILKTRMWVKMRIMTEAYPKSLLMAVNAWSAIKIPPKIAIKITYPFNSIGLRPFVSTIKLLINVAIICKIANKTNNIWVIKAYPWVILLNSCLA